MPRQWIPPSKGNFWILDNPVTKLPPRDRLTYEEPCKILWSFLVRLPRKCVRCAERGDVEDFHAHHLVRRNAKSVIFDLENGICLCGNCHTGFIHSTAPNGPRLARAWTEEKYADRLARLEAMPILYDRDWAGTFNGLWSELVRLNAEGEFRGYLGRHPAIARMWGELSP